MERYAVAELLPFINPTAIGNFLRAVWTGATDTMMVNLAGEITTFYLAPVGLTLHYSVGSSNTRVFTIQSGDVYWSTEKYPPRMWTLPSVPPCNSAHIVREMQELMHDEAVTKIPVTSRTIASATGTAPPRSVRTAGGLAREVHSVTIPVTYPQCGSEMIIRSPSTGERVK